MLKILRCRAGETTGIFRGNASCLLLPNILFLDGRSLKAIRYYPLAYQYLLSCCPNVLLRRKTIYHYCLIFFFSETTFLMLATNDCGFAYFLL